jgi:hypothetical protein
VTSQLNCREKEKLAMKNPVEQTSWWMMNRKFTAGNVSGNVASNAEVQD